MDKYMNSKSCKDISCKREEKLSNHYFLITNNKQMSAFS